MFRRRQLQAKKEPGYSGKMNSLPAKMLLAKAAKIADSKRQTVSKEEIVAKLNEIKYLSSQKKVPKLTLRKEMIHLENELKGVLNLEKNFSRHMHKESAKMLALKKEIKELQHKLSLVHDKDFTKKVDKISHLLGDELARAEVGREIKSTEEAEAKKTAEGEQKLDLVTKERIAALQNRLNALKHEIKIHTELETKSPEEIKEIEEKANSIQEKLMLLYEKYPEFLAEEVMSAEQEAGIKHEIFFSQPQMTKEFLLEEPLPLPPPPRIERRND